MAPPVWRRRQPQHATAMGSPLMQMARLPLPAAAAARAGAPWCQGTSTDHAKVVQDLIVLPVWRRRQLQHATAMGLLMQTVMLPWPAARARAPWCQSTSKEHAKVVQDLTLLPVWRRQQLQPAIAMGSLLMRTAMLPRPAAARKKARAPCCQSTGKEHGKAVQDLMVLPVWRRQQPRHATATGSPLMRMAMLPRLVARTRTRASCCRAWVTRRTWFLLPCPAWRCLPTLRPGQGRSCA